MSQRQRRKPLIVHFTAAAFVLATTTSSVAPVLAGGMGGGGGMPAPGPTCAPNKPIGVNKTINIYKPVSITKNIDITKNINASKNISIYKPVTITKNIDASKNITINKTITINKGGASSAEASAMATAFAQAMASANAQVTVNVGANAGASAGATYYANSYSETQIINRGGGDIGGAVEAQQVCHMQVSSVVKSIHAVCIAANGMEFPASHMTPETWIDSSYEGEVARCLPGARLKISIGDVVQSDEGMAASYEGATTLTCNEHEALRHYKDGMLKCAPVVPVPDCTERTNLRRYGTGDMFFTFRAQICLPGRSAQSGLTLSGMTLTGGVGD